jgi:rhodanese-related sulfurtransferase
MTPAPLLPAAAATRLDAVVVLDVRDAAAFHAGHLEGSGHLPASELDERRNELPPKDRSVLVVAASPAEARSAAARLAGRGHPAIWWLDGTLAELAGGRASRAPAARLWRPARFLEEMLPRLPRGRAADLASGAGREAVHLALHGFDVEAWDRDPEALRWAAALAERSGVAIRTVAADLEAADPGLPPSAYALIVCFRFLHRPLFPHIVRALAPGGMLVYETYRVGQEKYGKPRRPRFLLEDGELPRAFAALEILVHQEPTPPGGPITARLLARKPS